MLNRPQHIFDKELSKCQLLCKKCHNRKTCENKEFGTPPYTPGERHGMAKLTDVTAMEILACTGVSQYELARRYKVSRSTIAALLSRKTWKHLDISV